MWSLKKNDTNELIYRREIDSDIENKLMVTKGVERDKLYIYIYIYMYIYIYISESLCCTSETITTL